MAKRKKNKERTLFNFIIADDMAHGLKTIEDRDGVSRSEQVRRAVAEWLKVRGIKVAPTKKANRKREVEVGR